MDIRYAPDISKIGSVEYRPYMIEVAWNYCQTALGTTHRRGMVEQTLACLAVEIVLKTYNAVAVANHGNLNEKYQFQVPQGIKLKNGHDLVALADILRPDLRQYLVDAQDERVLDENRNVFSKSRYYYEPSDPTSSSSEPMKLAVKMICKTIYLYKKRGFSDPFIDAFNVDAEFFSHVQRFAWVGADA